MSEGIITKGVGGTYTVRNKEGNLLSCMIRGKIRNKSKIPCIGDIVDYESSGDPDIPYVIVGIKPRKNYLVRPPIANVDYLFLSFAVKDPEPDLKLLDKMLIICAILKITPYIIFTKADLDRSEAERLHKIYSDAGYRCFISSLDNPASEKDIFKGIENSLIAFAGPSGVGKSTMCNAILNREDEEALEVGEVSERLKRGKHTTRHVELFRHDDSDNDITDTPGFTSLSLLELGIGYDEIVCGYPELIKASEGCKFDDCRHINEKNCNVLSLLKNGDIIDCGRYERYKEFYQETYDNRNNFSIKVIKWRD
ncbi:MAG: ribosome small subunit-dependent GTPase A [Clostridia bacterium]|nr:ribosome small subunit-dependent GTPase A [Clostridia bacterium]